MATVPDKSGNTVLDRHIPTARDASAAYGAFDIVPNDVADLKATTRAIVASGAGDASVIMDDGSEVTLVMQAEKVMAVRVRRVLATGTTATGIVGLL